MTGPDNTGKNIGNELSWRGKFERRAILSWLAIAIAPLAFFALADAVFDGDMNALDERILLSLRTAGNVSDPIGPAWFEAVMRDFTALGSNGIAGLILIAASGYLLLKARRDTALLLITTILGSIAIASLVKFGYARPRPDLVPHATEIFTSSFPSSHAAVSATVYLTLGALIARGETSPNIKRYVLTVAITMTALVGLSRVYLGVHWPSDVLAGWIIGAALALAALAAASWLDRRRHATQQD